MSLFPAGLKLHSLSLHTKLILALTVLVAVVVAGSAYLQIERERSRGLSELEARASALADLLSRSLAQPLWNVDLRTIDHQLAALSDNAEVDEFSVTAVNYGLVSTVTRDRAKGTSGSVVHVRPIEYAASEGSPAEKIGEVRVVLSRALTDAAIARFRSAILFIAAAIILSLSLATFVLLKRMVRHPINRLEEMVGRIAGGDLHARCRVASGDELGRLAARVNDMADRLCESTAQLRESEHYLAQVQRLSHTGSWALDPATGKAIYWSEEMFRIHGLDPQRSHAPDLDELPRFWHPDDRDWVVERIRTTIRDKAEYAAEHRLVLPDGTIRHLRAIGHPLLDDAGGLVEYVGTVMDITDRKRAEEALHKAQAELAHVTRVTTVNALASSIAHEVSQPLGAVVANADAALRWLAREPPELDEARETLRCIAQDGHRAGEVIGRVRALLRKTDTVTAHLDLNDLIHDTVALVHGAASRHRILLRTELAPDLPRVGGDRVQLQQVLLNLLLNGIEAMKDVAERPRELLLRSQPDGSGVVLVSVQDTGVGLDPRSVERVFEAFYTTKPEGLGMGLAICRSIVEAHGGRLWAAAHEPHGTVFQFTLPSEPDLTAPAAPAGPDRGRAFAEGKVSSAS